MKSIEKQGKIMEDDCPYLRSFILESSRCFPIMSLESIFDASGINWCQLIEIFGGDESMITNLVILKVRFVIKRILKLF